MAYDGEPNTITGMIPARLAVVSFINSEGKGQSRLVVIYGSGENATVVLFPDRGNSRLEHPSKWLREGILARQDIPEERAEIPETDVSSLGDSRDGG